MAEDIRAQTLVLLGARAADQTMCPSEVARSLAGTMGRPSDWRAWMPGVHDAVDALVAEQRIALRWKGVGLATRSGPYRIGRGSNWS